MIVSGKVVFPPLKMVKLTKYLSKIRHNNNAVVYKVW